MIKNFTLYIAFLGNVCIAGSQRTPDQNAKLGLAIESFVPCGDRFITMEREIGRPSEVEKYWEGTLDLTVYKKYIKEARITLILDNPATITMDADVGRIYNLAGNTFHFDTYGIPDSINFVVQGSVEKNFPNIQEVTLNGVKVCKKMTKWNPTLLRIGDRGVATPLLPKNFVSLFCGKRILEHTTLITKASPTKPGDWPWHVALYYSPRQNKSSYRCGGTIISRNYAITAGHCVTESRTAIPASKLYVVVGKYHLYMKDEHAIEIPVSQVIVHPEFTSVKLKNDIAILKFAHSIHFTDYVQPICLWNAFNIYKEKIWGLNGTVVGWGTTEFDTLSSEMQVASMGLVSDTTCLLSFPSFYKRFLSETTFCAGNGNGTSVCNGDSGGSLVIPLTLQDNNIVWFLRGVVSNTVARADKNLCDPKHYVVFTDVAQYLPWIHDNTDVKQ